MTSTATNQTRYSDCPGLDLAQSRQAAAELMDLRGNAEPASQDDWIAISRFYYCEARLLDEEQYDDWYDLLADDLFYWMPLTENRFRRDPRATHDPENMALFDETKRDIAVRIGRLSSRLVWTEDPPTRHCYVVSNIEAFRHQEPGCFEVHSAFVQYRNRSEHDEATLVGRRRDLIRQAGESFQIYRRMIVIPQSILLTKNLSVFF